jgi:hypothetical protein
MRTIAEIDTELSDLATRRLQAEQAELLVLVDVLERDIRVLLDERIEVGRS